jgi:hypothetical protein
MNGFSSSISLIICASYCSPNRSTKEVFPAPIQPSIAINLGSSSYMTLNNNEIDVNNLVLTINEVAFDGILTS